ncbi:MAG: glutaredoxin family protein [bacterium]|nr:glutaredoxin family protein [bacterium]
MQHTAEMTNERQEPSAKFPANASSTTPVTIYTTPSDARSAKAREWFKAHNIPFTDHNVVADPEALSQMIKVSGSRRIPVVQIGDRVFVGFDENQLAASLPEN